MELTDSQYALLSPLLPVQRGNVKIDNRRLLNALLYIENGCKWRRLPKEYGNWHTVYMRLRRWADQGVLDRLFETLQRQRLIEIRDECHHDQVEALTMGDRIVVMNEGRIYQVGTPDELYDAPDNKFVASFIGTPAIGFLTCRFRPSRLVRSKRPTPTLSRSASVRSGWCSAAGPNTAPGLGISLDTDKIQKAATDWRLPDTDWTHPDGTFAEW